MKRLKTGLKTAIFEYSGLERSLFGRSINNELLYPGQYELAQVRCRDHRFGGFFRLDMFGKIVRVPTLDVIAFEEDGIFYEFLK